MEIFIIIWLVCAFLGLAIGNQKGQALAGFVLGFVLGFIGLVILLFLPNKAPQAATVGAQRETVAPERSIVPAGWKTDPTGENELRYWDGYKWTENVHTYGS